MHHGVEVLRGWMRELSSLGNFHRNPNPNPYRTLHNASIPVSTVPSKPAVPAPPLHSTSTLAMHNNREILLYVRLREKSRAARALSVSRRSHISASVPTHTLDVKMSTQPFFVALNFLLIFISARVSGYYWSWQHLPFAVRRR